MGWWDPRCSFLRELHRTDVINRDWCGKTVTIAGAGSEEAAQFWGTKRRRALAAQGDTDYPPEVPSDSFTFPKYPVPNEDVEVSRVEKAGVGILWPLLALLLRRGPSSSRSKNVTGWKLNRTRQVLLCADISCYQQVIRSRYAASYFTLY